MNGSDSRRPGVPAPSDRAQGGISPRQGGSSASPWRESQSLSPQPEALESPRVAVASTSSRTSSGWLREPALDPRRLMPPPRRDGSTERSFSPAPARREPTGPPPAPAVERSRNGSPARQSEPQRPSAPPPSNNGHGRFTERPAPPARMESVAPPEILEPQAPLESEPEAPQPSRFIAPTPIEPSRGRAAATAPEARPAAAPPAQVEPFEIEPPRPIVPPLWERLRDHTPLFRSESKRSRETQSNLAPHRFIAPPPVEQAPEKPAAAAPEPVRSSAPVPQEREPNVSPQRFIAPAPVDATPKNPAIPASEARRSVAAPSSEPALATSPQRFIAPAPVERQPETAPQPVAQPKATSVQPPLDRATRSVAPPPSDFDLEMTPASPAVPPLSGDEENFGPYSPRPHHFLLDDEPLPDLEQPFEPELASAVAGITSAAPAERAPDLEEDEPYWPVEPISDPIPESISPHFAAPPPIDHASHRSPASSGVPMRTVAPPPFEFEQELESPRPAASFVPDRFPEPPPLSATELERTVAPPSVPPIIDERMNIEPSRSAASVPDELLQDSSAHIAAGRRRAVAPPSFEPDLKPASHPPSPDRSRHWSALFDEDLDSRRIESDMEHRRAAPPERKFSPTPEPSSDSTESFRAATPPASERLRESAPVFATEPWRSAASPLHEMESAPEWPHPAASHTIEPEMELPHHSTEAGDEDDSGEPRDPMFPKLLKRLATVGRAALPIVPHVLPREGAIGATVSAVTAVSSALASRSAQQPSAAQHAPTMPKIDLAPIDDNLDLLRAAQRELRDKVADQKAVLDRVQDQVDMLCEAANRVESEQRDLVAELKFFSKWALVFAVGVSVLLMATVAFEVVLILRP